MSSSSSSSSSTSSGLISAEQQQEANAIITTFKAMRAQITELAEKISELNSDRNEHSLVVRAISPLDPSRRCYRNIGGVLVERTVGEVLPAVEKNLKGIEELIAKLSADLKQKEVQADEFRAKHNIQIGEIKDSTNNDEDDDDDDDSSRTGGSSSSSSSSKGASGRAAGSQGVLA